MNHFFIWNERLGIPLPELDRSWELFREEEQTFIVTQWEIIRGSNPRPCFCVRKTHKRKAG